MHRRAAPFPILACYTTKRPAHSISLGPRRVDTNASESADHRSSLPELQCLIGPAVVLFLSTLWAKPPRRDAAAASCALALADMCGNVVDLQ